MIKACICISLGVKCAFLYPTVMFRLDNKRNAAYRMLLFKKMFSLRLLIVFCLPFVLMACKGFTNEVLYKSPERINLQNIGVANLVTGREGAMPAATVINTTYIETVLGVFKEVNMQNGLYVNETIRYINPEPEIISEVCAENGFDALLISRFNTENVVYTSNGVLEKRPIGTGVNTGIEIKLYDKTGKMLMHILNGNGINNSIIDLKSLDYKLVSCSKEVVFKLLSEVNSTKTQRIKPLSARDTDSVY
jgi:hypothetical protein